MKVDGQEFYIAEKVFVGCENRYPGACGNGTDQEIDMGTLNAGLTARIVEFRRPFIILSGNGEILESL